MLLLIGASSPIPKGLWPLPNSMTRSQQARSKVEGHAFGPYENLNMAHSLVVGEQPTEPNMA